MSDHVEKAIGSDPNNALDRAVARATNDWVTIEQDATATAIDVLANDSDPDGTPAFSIASVTQPLNGTVIVGSGGVGLNYEPNPGYSNDGVTTDPFTYTLTPGGSTATVFVTVRSASPLNIPALPLAGFVFLALMCWRLAFVYSRQIDSSQ